jgi:SAM-dependent methyltransferase
MHKDKWNKRYSGKELLWPQEPSEILKKETEDCPPGRALDLAAGEGRNSFFLATQGWEVTAVDFSEVAVQKGRELARKLELPVKWEVQDLTAYRPAKGSYDCITIFYLHLPWEEFSEVLRRAAAALRPQGVLLVVGHDSTNLEAGTGGPQHPNVLYSPTDITALLGTIENLEVERAERQRQALDHGEGERGAAQINCVVKARRIE